MIVPQQSSLAVKYFYMSLTTLIKRMYEQKFKENGLGYIDPKQNLVITTHGFRSTFRDWSTDKTDYPREVCEHVLAHKLPDEIEAYYLRGRYLEKLMADWAIYIMHKRPEAINYS